MKQTFKHTKNEFKNHCKQLSINELEVLLINKREELSRLNERLTFLSRRSNRIKYPDSGFKGNIKLIRKQVAYILTLLNESK